MEKKNLILVITFLLATHITLNAQSSNIELKNIGASGKSGTIGKVNNVSNSISILNYIIDYKNDTLYTLVIKPYDIFQSVGNSQGGVIVFNSDTLSLGKIKNYIKEVANGEQQQLIPPISINNTFFIVIKSKKNLSIAMVNNNGLLPTTVRLSKNDINKLFDDKFLQ